MNHLVSNPVIAYLGLGSNLAIPKEQIKSARSEIKATEHIEEIAFSSLYQSLPMGPENQPDYVNAVMAISTDLPPLALLGILQRIENKHGRERKGERWGARTLDLDVLLYDDQLIESPELSVPHPGIELRSFVLYPLAEIAPQLIIPGKGKVTDLLANCPLAGLKKLDSYD